MIIQQTGPGSYAAGASLEFGGSLVDYALDAEKTREPRRGDRFVHMRYLADGVTRPEKDEDYAVRVVTHVTATEVYHIDAASWDGGYRPRTKHTRYVSREEFNTIVRKWT